MTGKGNSYVAIVDDDESVCRSLGRLLRTGGFQSVSYPSAEDFLGDSKRPKFDFLILDLQLPGISGIELSRRLSAVNDSTPILFITAQDDEEECAMAKESGCVGFFRKTDPGALILDAIQNAVHCANEPETPRNPTPLTP